MKPLVVLVAAVVLFFIPYNAYAAGKGGKQSKPQAQQAPEYKWPFRQNEKKPGVEFEDRQVTIPKERSAVREWQGGAPVQIDGKYTDGPLMGRVECVSESTVYVQVAGKANYIGISKSSLIPADRKYVHDLEVKLAKEMGEPPVAAEKKPAPKKGRR